MKLNLVPTYVSRESKSAPAILIGIVMAIIGVVVAVVIIGKSKNDVDAARADNSQAQADAASAKAISDQADAVMADAKVHDIVRDTNLAKAMSDHCYVYPRLYDTVRQYVPSYFRLTSLSAAPGDDTTCVVTLTGVVSTYQQYADLGLAMLRMPGAQSYSPSGYTITDKYVPPITPDDLSGRPIRPGEQNIPDDPQARFNRMLGEGKLTGYLGDGYGPPSDAAKGPMPDASLVTMVVTLKSDPKKHFDADLMTPNPRATLAASGGGGAAGGAGAGGNAPAAGAAAGFGGPPAGASAAPPSKGKKSAAASDGGN
jgi:hypothetical protein